MYVTKASTTEAQRIMMAIGSNPDGSTFNF
jgi:hypothetical protein